jgi:predicted DNA-binding transcriptional regulator YafY
VHCGEVKNERPFAIVNHLLTRGRTGAHALVQRFEASERTSCRDIDSLSASGSTVVALSGTAGAFEMEADFRIDRNFLTVEELADPKGTVGGLAEALKSHRLKHALNKLAGSAPGPATSTNGAALVLPVARTDAPESRSSTISERHRHRYQHRFQLLLSNLRE